VAILNMDYGSDRNQAAAQKPPVFRNMQFENITGDGAPTAILIQGLAASPIENIRFVNSTLRSTKGVVANYAKGLVFDNVQVIPARGAVFDLNEVTGVVIRKSNSPKEAETFLKLSGKISRGVRIEACDLAGAKQKFILGEGVAAEAVAIHD
jgi:hypothetical protein